MTKLMAGRAIEFGLAERLATLKNQVDNRVDAFYTDATEAGFGRVWLAVNVHEVKKTTDGIC